MPQGYYTIEQWFSADGTWRPVATLPFGLSLTAAEKEVEKLHQPGLYRLVQMQRVMWAENDGPSLRLRKSHASSPKSLSSIVEMYDRCAGCYPIEEVRAARRRAKEQISEP